MGLPNSFFHPKLKNCFWFGLKSDANTKRDLSYLEKLGGLDFGKMVSPANSLYIEEYVL